MNVNKSEDIKISDFKNDIKSYESECDIARAPARAAVYSYAKSTDAPILFRHYKHLHTQVNGIVSPRISHDFCKIFVFISGNVNFLIENVLYSPNCGSILTIRGGVSYQPIFYEQSNIDYYEIDFPPDFFESVPNNSPFYNMFFGEKNGMGCNITPSHQTLTNMFKIFERIEKVIESNAKYSDFLIYSELIMLSAIICDSLEQSSKTTAEQKIPNTLKQALSYIIENFTDINDTEKIAKHCHISVSYLCRIFKKYLGMTPVEYINSQKLAKARYLLKSGMNVTEACFNAGFSSYNYFIHLFKKNVGQTPGEYKNN
ncbi:MAG: helix-turn-helix transcriptional regulator [Ruminococcaceae bacterium]|nr:helix-turn-helix transcriptional regulator [Oscillospiraceae bacterium]